MSPRAIASVDLTGLNVVSSVFATTEHWNFKASPYRSRRLIKKLLKRHGVQVERRPAMFRTVDFHGRTVIVAHPALIAKINDRVRSVADHRIEQAFFGCNPPAAGAALTMDKLRADMERFKTLGGAVTTGGGA